MAMKISVIVPVYNVEKYLPRCIDSILAQSFTDFELILVDDGSKDSSGKICEAYVTKDDRVKVLHKENGGASTARNAGIEIARGTWICFIDSDDYVLPNYLQGMYERTKGWDEGKTYMVMTGLKSKIWKAILPDAFINAADLPLFIAKNGLPLSPCGKLFLTNILKEQYLRFTEGITNGEDFVFVCDYLSHVDGICSFDSKEYIYQVQEGSASLRYMPFEENLRNYQAMRNAWEHLVRTVGTTADRQYLLWHSGVQTRFSYLLTGIFHKPMSSIKEQLCLLRRIEGDIKDFSCHADVRVKRSCIARFLLHQKCYFLYVLFNRILVMIGKGAAA